MPCGQSVTRPRLRRRSTPMLFLRLCSQLAVDARQGAVLRRNLLVQADQHLGVATGFERWRCLTYTDPVRRPIGLRQLSKFRCPILGSFRFLLEQLRGGLMFGTGMRSRHRMLQLRMRRAGVLWHSHHVPHVCRVARRIVNPSARRAPNANLRSSCRESIARRLRRTLCKRRRRRRQQLRTYALCSAAPRSRRALATTDTEDRLLASAANMGLNSTPARPRPLAMPRSSPCVPTYSFAAAAICRCTLASVR